MSKIYAGSDHAGFTLRGKLVHHLRARGHRGVRAVDAWNVEGAKMSRAHNDANVLCLGERLLAEAEALAVVDAWLATAFEGGRHGRRVAQIAALEIEESQAADLRPRPATTDVQQ